MTDHRLQRACKERRGFSLAEMAITLAITGIVMATLWALAAESFGNARAVQAASELEQAVHNVRLYYYGRQAATADTPPQDVTLALIKGGVFPSDWVQGEADERIVENSWGGRITAETAVIGSAPVFALTFEKVPLDACVRLTVHTTEAASATGLRMIRIGTDTGETTQGGEAPDDRIFDDRFPLSAAQASTACRREHDTGGAEKISLRWQFTLRS